MILVIGGAGYIGSHVVKELIQQDYRTVVLDNLSSGHRGSVDIRAVFEYGDYTNPQDLERVFSRYSIDAVMYFVGVGFPTLAAPSLFVQKENQFINMQALLRTMLNYQITHFILSSTIGVHEETRQVEPTNKVSLLWGEEYNDPASMLEQMLGNLHNTYGLNSVALRYFNAAGAHESGEIGEDHAPQTHLISQVLRHVLHHTPLTVDIGYDTPDSTCIRDYLHVMDVARAHVLALKGLLLGREEHAVYTLGTGYGSSVRDVIQAVEKVTGRSASIQFSPLSVIGEPQIFVPVCNVPEELGWKAEYSLEDIITSAWNWHIKYPNGYESKLEFAL